MWPDIDLTWVSGWSTVGWIKYTPEVTSVKKVTSSSAKIINNRWSLIQIALVSRVPFKKLSFHVGFKSMFSAQIENEPIYSRTKSSFNLEIKRLAVNSAHKSLLLFSIRVLKPRLRNETAFDNITSSLIISLCQKVQNWGKDELPTIRCLRWPLTTKKYHLFPNIYYKSRITVLVLLVVSLLKSSSKKFKILCKLRTRSFAASR